MLHKWPARWPARHDLFEVYSFIVFIVFTWTIYRAAWQMQSWLYSMSLLQVLILFAYVLAFTLLESLAVLGFVVGVAVALPARFFRAQFVAQGSALVCLLTLLAVALQGFLPERNDLSLTQVGLALLIGLAGLLVFMIASARLLERVRPLAGALQALAGRLTVFSFVYVPLSLLGWVVVIVRNLR